VTSVAESRFTGHPARSLTSSESLLCVRASMWNWRGLRGHTVDARCRTPGIPTRVRGRDVILSSETQRRRSWHCCLLHTAFCISSDAP
jgi:hypothetical protein